MKKRKKRKCSLCGARFSSVSDVLFGFCAEAEAEKRQLATKLRTFSVHNYQSSSIFLDSVTGVYFVFI